MDMEEGKWKAVSVWGGASWSAFFRKERVWCAKQRPSRDSQRCAKRVDKPLDHQQSHVWVVEFQEHHSHGIPMMEDRLIRRPSSY